MPLVASASACSRSWPIWRSDGASANGTWPSRWPSTSNLIWLSLGSVTDVEQQARAAVTGPMVQTYVQQQSRWSRTIRPAGAKDNSGYGCGRLSHPW